MVRFLSILLCILLILGLCSCQDQKKIQKKPIWEDTKITDLMPTNSGSAMVIKEATFEVSIIEVPADDKNTIRDIQRLLYDKPLNINNPQVFAKNNFSVGFNRIDIKDRINQILRNTNSTNLENISILIPTDQQSQIYAKRILKKQNIYYSSEDGTTEAITAGPGDIVLELEVKAIEAQRGICKLYAKPAFLSPLDNRIAELSENTLDGNLNFPSVGFNVNMGPGDLIILTPVAYINNQDSLGSLFFCYNKPAAVQRIFIITCSRVNF
ncbi:MAG TPA: hypothetical protein PLP05_04790 [Sedimentisphaerales bacterium]|nr:hypothetical protein [Sedimentisphaerales bacterium]